MSHISVDRRNYPRFPINFTVDVDLPKYSIDGCSFTVEGLNISRSSMEISCNGKLIDALIAQEGYPHTCVLNFQLPELKIIFDIDAQVVTHRRLSQHHYQLVMVFTDMDERLETRLENYLASKQSMGILAGKGNGANSAVWTV